jgi:drug/metabolite transporter (DMT)-like permease
MFAIPVIALLLSMAIFGEVLSSSEWLGIAAIGVGLVLITGRALRNARAGSPLRDAAPLEGG